MFSGSKFKMTPAFCTLGVLIALAALPALAAGPEDQGPWSVTVSRLAEWTKAAGLPGESEVLCHFYGAGKFRVFFRQGEASQKYTVEIQAIEDWFTFKRTLQGGPVEIRVETVSEARYPKPVFRTLIVTVNPQFVPSVDDVAHPLYMQAVNLGDADAQVAMICYCGNPSHSYYALGRLAADGFDPSGVLKAKERSVAINLSRCIYNRTVFTCRPGPGETDVELRFFADWALTQELKSVHLRGKPAGNFTVVIYPKEKGFTLCTVPELLDRDQAALTAAFAKDPRPVPKRSHVYVGVMDVDEDMDLFLKEVAFVRQVGANGCWPLGRLEAKRAELGFTCYWDMNFLTADPAVDPYAGNFTFNPQIAPDYVAKKCEGLPKGQPCVLILSDEDTYGGTQLVKNPDLDKRFVAWLKEKGLTPGDAGAAAWEEVKCIAPDPARPKLSVLSHDFQVGERIKYWDGYGREFKKCNADLQPAVNFAVGSYYWGISMDFWELYRQPGLDIVWGEDWHDYMPRGMGGIAWYADLMRSQAKYRNLPTAVYPILGYGYSPALDTMRFYERFMRGCYTFDCYPYTLRGNEPTWLDDPAIVVNVARRFRDLAQVEDILIDGRVLPAKVALLYPYSCTLWDRNAYTGASSLYYANLHAGIQMDIVTEQDLVDGLAKDYRLICCVGANMRRDAVHALDAFIQGGGVVACASPRFKDPYNQPISDAPAVFGAGRVEQLADEDPGSYATGNTFQGAIPIDTVKWNGKQINVYFRKSRLVPAEGAEVLATFSDGSPAIIKSRRGKGAVLLYAFSPGLSYMKAPYSLTGGFATQLCANNVERDISTLGASGIPCTVACSAAMVSSRVVVSNEAAMVGLVDYGLGETGRAAKGVDMWQADFETMKPYPVTVRIACKAKPQSVTGVRCGTVEWKYASGQLTVEVPLRGVEMLVLKGRDLF